MKKICMIAVGGTIASVETQEGLQPEISSEEILTYIPEVSGICQIDTIQLFNIDSTNLYAKHWKALVECIEENYEAYDGFVVTHGTDTMAYTAAALSYFIQNSRKPIVITGSQITIAAENTDARENREQKVTMHFPVLIIRKLQFLKIIDLFFTLRNKNRWESHCFIMIFQHVCLF